MKEERVSVRREISRSEVATVLRDVLLGRRGSCIRYRGTGENATLSVDPKPS